MSTLVLRRAVRSLSSSSFALFLPGAFLVGWFAVGCKDEPKSDHAGTPPPPPVASAKSGVCDSGGGKVEDSITSAFFPRVVAGYCLDPQGETRTYGENGKLSMDEVCTTAFDGECEVYKSFHLKRLVTLRYIDGQGKGSSVEVKLSQFADAAGAYGMFTKRVVADQDPADSKFARPEEAGGAAAIGSGVSYLWKGPYLAELTYINEEQAPAALVKSAEAILPPVMREIGTRIPGPAAKPASAAALPTAALLPLGVQYYPEHPLKLSGVPFGAVGFYREGAKRFRALAIAGRSEQVKDAFKALRTRPGALPVKDLGEEGIVFMLQEAPERAKCEYVAARVGALVLAVGDEDMVLKTGEPLERQASLRLGRDEKIQRLKDWFTKPVAAAPSGRPLMQKP